MIAMNIILGMYLTIGESVFDVARVAKIEKLSYMETARIFRILKERGYLEKNRCGFSMTQKAMELCADMSAFQNHEELFAKYNFGVKNEN